jgi:hypothetical protein
MNGQVAESRRRQTNDRQQGRLIYILRALWMLAFDHPDIPFSIQVGEFDQSQLKSNLQ